MANSHTNSKGVTYYFHRKGHLQYFSKDANGAVDRFAAAGQGKGVFEAGGDSDSGGVGAGVGRIVLSP